MALSVRLIEVEPRPTAVVRETTSWTEFPTRWKPMLDEVWQFLRNAPAGIYKNGHNVMLYVDDLPTVEIGVQVSGTFEPRGRVVPSQLPGGRVAAATHTGPINLIGDTHHAVETWCAENSHPLTRVRWEVYGDPDPSTGHFDVEVFWALEIP